MTAPKKRGRYSYQIMAEEDTDRVGLQPFDDEEPSSKKNWSLLSSWKERSKDFFNESSFHGPLYVFASKSWIKRIIWAIVILIAVGGFLTVSILHIMDLAREPTATSITLTRENELVFPAVTICSLGLLNVTVLQSGGPDVINELTDLFDDILDRADVSTCKIHANSLASTTGLNISWGELTNIAPNDLRTLLQSCTYSGERCSADDFVPINTVGGRCYTFNKSPQPRLAQGTGIRKGLHLRLSPDYQDFSLFRDYGFRIVIHNSDELPRPESEGVVVGLNSTIYIGMKQVKSIDATQFSSGHQCRKATYDSDQEFSFPGYASYSPSLCQAECFFGYVANKCDCLEKNLYVIPDGSRFNQFRNCTAPDLCCAVEAFDEVNESCDCPPRCETVERTLTISSATAQDALVSVNVFYESLILETRVTTDSYTPWGLISDIGGNTGLFLGFTLLSVVELLMLVLGLIKDCCCCCKKQSVRLS